MGNLILLVGPPGTGKTEFDLRVIEAWLCRGTPREEIAYFTFMKSAALEGAYRMGITSEEAGALWFRTLHSACFRILRLTRKQVVTSSWLRGLGKRLGVPLESPQEGRDIEEVAELLLQMRSVVESSSEKPTMSRYRALYNLSRLLSRTLDELDRVRSRPHPGAAGYLWPDFVSSTYTSFVNFYEREKQADGMYDFVDMLERVFREDVPLPRWRYAVVDEVQDLSGLQLAVIEKLVIARCETTLLSGDDHQAIMTFQGARASDFLSFRDRATVIQLTQTRRFGQRIVDFSADIASRIRERHEREVVGLPGKDSVVETLYGFDPADVRDGDLIMHRHVAGCHEVASKLVGAGVPFWNERGPNPLARTSEIRAYKAWKRVAVGASVDGDSLQYLESHVPARKDGVQLIVRGMAKRMKEMAPGYVVHSEEIGKYFTGDFLNAARREDPVFLECPFVEYYQRLDRNGHKLNGRPATKITTIHGAKGRQAPRTWLWSEVYPKVLSSWSDEEHRVAYVGATRAQDCLLVVNDNIVGDWTHRYPYPNGEA